MGLLQILALLSKLGPKALQAWPYIQQIIEAVQNILLLLNAPTAAGKPDPAAVAQLVAAGATQDEAEKAVTTLETFDFVT